MKHLTILRKSLQIIISALFLILALIFITGRFYFLGIKFPYFTFVTIFNRKLVEIKVFSLVKLFAGRIGVIKMSK